MSLPHENAIHSAQVADDDDLKYSKACMSCQRRKKRCNSQKPCERCLQFNEECIYAAEKKRGPKRRIKDDPSMNMTTPDTKSNVTSPVPQLRKSKRSKKHSDPDPLDSDLPQGETTHLTFAETTKLSPPFSTKSPPPVPTRNPSERSTRSPHHPPPKTPGLFIASIPLFDITSFSADQLESYLDVFFAHFYPFIPIFTKSEFRSDLHAGRIPQHLICSLCAVSSLFISLPFKQQPMKLRGKLKKQPSLGAPQPDFLAQSAHALLMPMFTSHEELGVHECMSLILLSTFYYCYNRMDISALMKAQVMQAITWLTNGYFSRTPNANSHQFSDEIISRLFWTGYSHDRLATAFNTGSTCLTPLLSIEAIECIPRMPQFNDPGMSPISGSVSFKQYVNATTLMCRTEAWIRNQYRRLHRRKRQNEDPLNVVSPAFLELGCTGDTLKPLYAAAHAWRNEDNTPPAIDTPNPKWTRDVVARSISETAYWWLVGHWIFYNAVLYIETCPRERWHIIYVVTTVAPNHATARISSILRLAAEFALSLITEGIVSPAPICKCKALTRDPATITGGNALTSYPKLIDVIHWFESAMTRLHHDFWIVVDDLFRIENVVKQLREIYDEQQRSPVSLHDYACADHATYSPFIGRPLPTYYSTLGNQFWHQPDSPPQLGTTYLAHTSPIRTRPWNPFIPADSAADKMNPTYYNDPPQIYQPSLQQLKPPGVVHSYSSDMGSTLEHPISLSPWVMSSELPFRPTIDQPYVARPIQYPCPSTTANHSMTCSFSSASFTPSPPSSLIDAPKTLYCHPASQAMYPIPPIRCQFATTYPSPAHTLVPSCDTNARTHPYHPLLTTTLSHSNPLPVTTNPALFGDIHGRQFIYAQQPPSETNQSQLQPPLGFQPNSTDPALELDDHGNQVDR